MAIGLVTEAEYAREISKKGNASQVRGPINEPHHSEDLVEKESHASKRGRSEGDLNVPDGLRKLIGEDALLNGRQSALDLAKDLGISPSSASAYAVGATSTKSYNQPSKTILEYLNSSRQRAMKRASKTLNGALSAISQEKLDYADAKDLAVIAKNMSAIIKDLEPQQVPTESVSKTPQFVIFAPQFRTESSFDVIDVKE